MSLELGSRPASLVDRAKNIILKPSLEWDRIDGEPATIQGLFTGYAMILAAIGPVCHALGMVVFGVGIPGIAVYHASLVGALLTAIVTYVLTLAGVFVLGLIIEALAPNFGGVKDRVQAMKVAVYSSTAGWLCGVFQLIPMLGILAILGLYSLYLLYLGLPKLMKTAQDKAMGYTALVVVCYIVLFFVIAAITAPLAMVGAMTGGGLTTLGSTAGGTVQVGGAAVDLGKLQAASAQMQAQAAAMQASAAAAQANAATGGAVTTTTVAGVQGTAPAALAALLPASVGGFARGDVSSESTGAAGLNASHAEAQYARGDARMSVEITDMAAMGGLGSLASAFNVNSSKQTATGYEKVSTAGGRMTTEEYDNSSRHGKYSVMAGGRFMIEASGDNVTMDDLKGAVNAVGPDRVAGLARG